MPAPSGPRPLDSHLGDLAEGFEPGRRSEYAAPRLSLPGAPVDGVRTSWVSVVISSQTGGSGAPEITDDQPLSGGPSEGASQHHWRSGAPEGDPLRAE